MRKAILGWLLMLVFGGVAAAQPVPPRPIPYSMLGALNGVATLDATGRISTAQTSAIAAIQSRFAEPLAKNTGLLARYLFTEGTGSTLDDVSGLGNNATCPSTNGPSWGGDGTLDWTPGVSLACPLPAAITGVRTIEWMTNNTVVLPPASFQKPTPIYNSPIGFSSGLGVSVFFYSTYDSAVTSSSPYQGYGTGYVNFGQQGTAHPDALLGFTDNGNHTFALVMNDSADTITLYEDGVQLVHATAAPARLAIAMSNVAWELGGQGAPSAVAISGFGGHMIYFSASTTAYTAGQVAQDDAAEKLLGAYKGVPSSPFFSAPYQDLDYTIGESVSAAHGLSNQKAMNFTSVADSYLNAAFPGDNFTGISNGQDTDNGYIEQASCVALEHGMSQSSGLKFLTFHEHGNALNALTGGYSNVDYWPSSSVTQTAAGIAAANLDGFTKCAAAAKGDGYATIIATAIGYGTPTSPSYRPAYNAYIRGHWAGRFDMLWDPVNDPRLGAEGAGLLTNNCTFGGSTGNTFQFDDLHPTQCGQDIMGHQKASVMAAWLLNGDQETSTVASTYPMVMTDLDGYLSVPGGGTITLWPVGGLAPAVRIVTITNTGSSPETITGGTEYDGGAQDLITSPASATPAATYSLPANTTKAFRVTFPPAGDTTGGPGGVTVTNG